MSTHQDESLVALRQWIAEECASVLRTWGNAATLARFLALNPAHSPLAVLLEQLSAQIGEPEARTALMDIYLQTMQHDWTLLPMRLPLFRQGYGAGRRDALTEGCLTDVELLDVLHTLVAEGLFSSPDDADAQYHILKTCSICAILNKKRFPQSRRERQWQEEATRLELLRSVTCLEQSFSY